MAIYGIRDMRLNLQETANRRRPVPNESPRSIRAIHKRRKSEKDKASIQNRMIVSVLANIDDKTEGRENDFRSLQDLPWNETSAVHATIPGSLSIRAPPSSIGGNADKKDLFIGITNLDASRRYISQLQRDRERNNQAVNKVMNTLPIQIKKVAKDAISPSPQLPPSRESGQRRNKNTTLLYPNHLGHDPPTYQNKLTAIKSCFHPLVGCKNCKKCSKSKKRQEKKKLDYKRDVISPIGTYRSERSTKSVRDAYFSYDSGISRVDVARLLRKNSTNIHAPGFHGYPIRSRQPIKATKKRAAPAFGHSSISEEDSWRKENMERGLNEQYNFVTSTLVSGQKIGNIKMKEHRKLPPITPSQSVDSRDTYPSTTSKHMLKSQELQYLSTNSMGLFESPGPLPLVPMHSFASSLVSKSQKGMSLPSNSPDMVLNRDEGVLLHGKELPIPKRVFVKSESPQSTSTMEADAYSENEINGSENGEEDLNLTDISEHEGSSVGQTERSEQAEVKMSVHIHYKQKDKEEVLREKSEESETINIPRWAKDENELDSRQSDAKSSVKSDSSVEDLEDQFGNLRAGAKTMNTHHTWDPNVIPSNEPTFISRGPTMEMQTPWNVNISDKNNDVKKYMDNIINQTSIHDKSGKDSLLKQNEEEAVLYDVSNLSSDAVKNGEVQYIAHVSNDKIVKTIEDAQNLAFSTHLESS